jgi:hypothetical protein
MRPRRAARPALAAMLAAALALASLMVALPSCRRAALVGSVTCAGDADCAPPGTICGADGRCVHGCSAVPASCVAGTTCDAATGECTGGTPISCTDDAACDPPELVCRPSTHTCVAGCTLSGCAPGHRCVAATGRCCDASAADCPAPTDMAGVCNIDFECVGAPANICSAGMCVPGCAQTGCTAPLTCTPSGHCALAACRTDADCDPGSYCAQSATCTVLSFAGKISCAGGTPVSFQCAQAATPAEFTACAGLPGPGGCPYCIDGSCFHPGFCQTVNDCHRGDECIAGLCRVATPECPQVVTIADINAGHYGAGKDVCVTGKVSFVRNPGYDGMVEIKIGTTPFLYVDETPLYGLRIPAMGETVTVHGTVRWDAGHNDYELLPIDWISP